MNRRALLSKLSAGALAVLFVLGAAASARAHCDSVNGPVVKAARQALDTKEITPVLRWIAPADEREIRAAFEKALSVRALGGDAKAVAERWFFETVVRVHRASEGEPFTGLKDDPIEPAIAAVDAALKSGDATPLLSMVRQRIDEGIRERFAEVRERQRHANESVEAGRAFVAAYVELMHYVERVAVMPASPHGGEGHR